MRKFFTTRHFHPVTGGLPVDGHVSVPGRFRFGYPWPWRETHGRQVTGPTGVAQDALVALAAPRSSGKAELVVWQEDGTFDASTDFENGIAGLYSGRLVLSRYVELDGHQAAVVDVDVAGGRRISRLVAGAPGGRLLHAEFDVPRSVAGGYLPHWDTVLASWEWR